MAALGDHWNVIDECLLITLAGSKPPYGFILQFLSKKKEKIQVNTNEL